MRRRSTSSALGGATLTTTSASNTAPASSTMRGAGLLVLLVGDQGAGARAALDDHVQALALELARRPPGPAPRGARPRPSPWGLRSARRGRLPKPLASRSARSTAEALITAATTVSGARGEPPSRRRARRDAERPRRSGDGAQSVPGRVPSPRLDAGGVAPAPGCGRCGAALGGAPATRPGPAAAPFRRAPSAPGRSPTPASGRSRASSARPVGGDQRAQVARAAMARRRGAARPG